MRRRTPRGASAQVLTVTPLLRGGPTVCVNRRTLTIRIDAYHYG